MAWGHAGEPLEPHDLWQAWDPSLAITLPLALTAALFAIGARKSRGVTPGQFGCFWGGWAVLCVALISPLHALGEALFSAHMAQHEILMLIAAPLLVVSRPLVPILWGLPLAWRKRLGRWSNQLDVPRGWQMITMPMTAWCLHAAVLWVWHAPRLFQATLSSDWIHSAQHLSFLGSAALFWWSLFYARGPASYGSGMLYIFTTAIHTSILGALLTLSRVVWYPAYALTTRAWNLSPLEDQQIGGLIMWVPAGLVYLGAGLWMLALWLRESEVMVKQRSYAQSMDTTITHSGRNI